MVARHDHTNQLRLGRSGLSSKSQVASREVVGRNVADTERRQLLEVWMHDGCALKLSASGRELLVRERLRDSAVDNKV